jgi:hypothetical protein
LREGFEGLGLDAVVSVTVPGNVGSRRVMEKRSIRYDTTTVTRTTGTPFLITGPASTKLATGIHFSNITIDKAPTPLLDGAHYSDLTTSNVMVNGAGFTPASSAP